MINIKRTIGIGLIMFIIALILNAIASKSLGTDLETTHPNNFPVLLWLLSLGVTAVLSVFGSFWYFSSPKVVANWKLGLQLGFTIAFLGFLLDVLAFLPLKGGLTLISEYYRQVWYWLPFALIVLISTLIGSYKDSRFKAGG